MRSVLLLAILMIASSVFGQAIFTDQSLVAGIDNTGQNRGVAIIAFDNDGWEDIYISRLNGANMLYRNLGDGSFQDVSENSGIAQNSNTLTATMAMAASLI